MKKAVLLVVDVQRALVEEEPYRIGPVLENIQRLLGFARSHGIEAVYVRHDDGPEAEEMAFGSPGWQISEAVAPQEGERIFDKRFNSAFLNTGLDSYLNEKGVETLAIVGMQTELCIDATVKSAFERGYQVLIPTDANTTFDNEQLSAAAISRFFHYKIWKNRFAQVLTPEETEKALLA